MRQPTIRSELRALKDPERARHALRFFKTGAGEYGEGDRFLGIRVPDVRRIVKKHRNASRNQILDLLHSGYHEERLTGLLILVEQYKRGDDALKKAIFSAYLANIEFINSWDLVDLTAPHIVGEYLFRRNRTILKRLARSRNLWERRIAILATFYFIRQGEDGETLKLSKMLLHDSHDLIHKAVGWMLREAGKRCSLENECRFLDKFATSMPRTMLRYAIERFPEDLRLSYMKK
ncbi:MAG: DNA alkylation repair protein [Acidobacteriota bacterium]